MNGRRPRGTGGLGPAEELRLRERHERMVVGRSTLGTEIRLAPEPTFRRAPEQIFDRGGHGFPAQALQAEFLARQAREPGLTPEQFLARLDPVSPHGRLVSGLLGEVSVTLLRTRNRQEFERAIRAAYQDFRLEPPPYDTGVSYGSYRYLTGEHVDDLRRSRLLVQPTNAPIFTREGLPRYPPYGDPVRQRANRSIAAIQASRIWNLEIPLDQQGRQLFETLQIDDSLQVYRWGWAEELQQTRRQVAFSLSTGYTPIFAFEINPPGKKAWVSPRNAEHARWELASRLGEPELLDAAEADVQRLWDGRPRAGRGTRRQGVATDPFTHLSEDELFNLALRRPGAPSVRLFTWEWEHHRPQRYANRVVNWIHHRLRLGDEWRSRISMLTGLSEPGNLHFLPPYEHAAVDFFAGALPRRGQNRGEGNRSLMEAFVANPVRARRRGGVQVSPQMAESDIPRVRDPLVTYDPQHLIPLITALQDDAVQRAAGGLRSATDRRAWNDIVRQLNARADQLTKLYGIPDALRLPTLN